MFKFYSYTSVQFYIPANTFLEITGEKTSMLILYFVNRIVTTFSKLVSE